jgi:hypothetical protein
VVVLASRGVPVRFVLVYQDQRVPLPDGVIVVGRSMSCQVRFNAPTVSRQHLLLHVAGENITAENLSTSTGTLVNGKKVTSPTRLSEGDELILGPRQVRIERADPDTLALYPTVPSPALGLLPDGDDDDEPTLTEDMPPVPHGTRVAFHTCPTCRTRVEFHIRICPSCSHVWGPERPSARLGQVTSPNFADDIPMPVSVMAIYASEVMTLDVVVTELSIEGVFIPTELLDAPGTDCEITLLPDGQAPLQLRGAVAAARAPGPKHGPSGLEVRFTEMSGGVRLWIELWSRRGRA